MTGYKPGSFFVVDVAGTGGFLIGLAQSLVNDASRYKHAGLILDTSGAIIEAEPRGARLSHISEYLTDGLLVSDAPILGKATTDPGWIDIALEKEYRTRVVAEARKLVGTGYSFVDYAALAALHLHLPSGWIRCRVESSGHLICSALVDLCYARAGIHLFSDGRLPGDVLPADLAAYAEDWRPAQ